MAAQQQRYSALKSSLMVPEDMQNLVAWYESKHGKRGTDQAPSLVVLIEDLEAFDGRTLTQLVTTLSKYTTQLPLVLLVGVATIPDALYNLVPRHTTNLLDVSHFFVDPGIGAFNALVRGLFIDFQPPLSIGPKAFSDMYRSFEDLHHSIDSTISYIQYLYMNYYLSSPFAPLNLSTSYRKSEHLSQESQEVLSTVSSLESQPQTIETLEGLESELESIRGERQEAFETLLIMLEFWDKKRSVENCLYLVLGAQQEGTVGGGINKLIQDLCGLVLQASSTKLLLFLKSLSERLGAYSAQHPASATTISRSLLAQLEDLETCLSKPRPNGRTNLINVNLASSTSGGGLPGFADLTGTSGGSGVSQVDREFSNIATQVSQGLKDKLQYALRPSREYKGHEIFYSDDTSASKRLNPNPLPTILKTLSRLDPHSSSTTHNRIRNREDDNDSTTKSKDIPLDLAIAYRVYKDLNPEGKLINLGDWWNGFQLAAGNEPGNDVDDRENEEELGGTKRMNVRDQRKKANKRRKTDNAESEENEDEDGASEEEEEDDQDEPARRKQARFLRAVADLAHLGFVHPTTRKPEHVLKSVY
ncbi:uncharacterized protein JCM15063_002176 [Sporobolomyces koalae]|uniref:uncharacterized protein n=1 Tax=Sporobolomyces koalae TaxID=500713 RepID=UPI003180FE77